ncbi:MAG: type II secretion system protein [Methylococcaceae bacterium]|jgi:general secretion pathway protein I|nr:type II secretion system protein [Methylococcaceae bacterium]
MRTDSGFSLIEIVFAFAIMTISLTVLMKVFSTGTQSAIHNENLSIAAQISESILAKAGVEQKLVNGEVFGTIQKKYRWSVIASLINQYKNTENQDTITKNLKLYHVRAKVVWLENEQEKSFETQTLKLQPESVE